MFILKKYKIDTAVNMAINSVTVTAETQQTIVDSISQNKLLIF